MTTPAVQLTGVYRLTLPVRDVARSAWWYRTRLGFETVMEVVEDGTATSARLRHPAGDPELTLRLDPARARLADGFDSFVIAAPSKDMLDTLAQHLTDLGEPHGGVHLTAHGWVLPLLHDTDGRELRVTATCGEQLTASVGNQQTGDVYLTLSGH
ncbi:MAG: VOC family protein [Actinophytocola sp.]|nr:VOC family protein [Actinophytocola sp.]